MRIVGLVLAILTCTWRISIADTTDSRLLIGGIQVPPYIIIDETGHTTGLLVEQIRVAFRETHIQPVFQITNWARAYHDIQHAHTDAIIPTMKTAERTKFLGYPRTPLTQLQMAFYRSAKNTLAFTGDFNALKGTSIGRIRNSSVSPAFDKVAQTSLFTLEERDSFSQLVLSVAHGRLDLIAGDELMVLWAAAENGVLDRVELAGSPLAHSPVYMAISKESHHAHQLERISDLLLKAQKSTEYQQAIKAYGKLLQEDIYLRLNKQSPAAN